MRIRASLLLLLVSVAAAPAFADDPTYTYGKKDDLKDVKDVSWTAKGEAGLIETTGNSKSTTITAGGNAVRKDKDNKLELTVTGTYARATTRLVNDDNGNGVIDNGELTSSTNTAAENAQAKFRYDRYLTTLDALFATAIAGVDVPAGKDFIGEGQAGYSRSLYHITEITKDKNGKDKEEVKQDVLAELGYDIQYISLSAGSSSTIHSGRAFVGYKGKFKDTTLEASLEGLFNLNSVTYGMRQTGSFGDTRLNALVGFTTSLSTKLSLAASFQLKFDNFPAPLAKIGDLPFADDFAPAAEKTDTITKLSLIFKFL
jgi:hypothetical protein